jgi:hypothetical protein
MLVRIRNVALARDQVGHGRTRQGNRVIWQVAENKQMELLGRRADGRNCLTISVGKICRMIGNTDHRPGAPETASGAADGLGLSPSIWNAASWDYGKHSNPSLARAQPFRPMLEGFMQVAYQPFRHHSKPCTTESRDGSALQKRGPYSRLWMISMLSARWTSREEPTSPHLQQTVSTDPLLILCLPKAAFILPDKPASSQFPERNQLQTHRGPRCAGFYFSK